MTIKRQKEVSLKRSRLLEQFRKEMNNAETCREFIATKQKMNVLLLDGDKNFCKDLSAKLQKHKKDSKIYVCQSEFTAMKLLKDSNIDLLIIGLELQNYDGFDFGRSIRSLMRKDYPILFFSRDENKQMDFYFQDITNAHFVHNPFDMEMIDEAFGNLISLELQKVS